MCVLLQCAVLDILVLNFPTAIVVSNNFPATTVLLRLIDGTSHVKRSCIPCYESFFFWLYPVSLMLLHIIDYYSALCPVPCIELWPYETGKYYVAWRVAVIINATHNFLSRQSSTFIW